MRKFLKVLSVILILFLVYNVVWAVLILPKYKGFKDAVGYDDQRKIWYCREGDYTYGVSAPGYLSFTGNLSVSAVVKVDKDGEMKNFHVIENVVKNSGMKVEIGGGIRDEKTIKKYADIGVLRVILGTIAVKDTEFLKNMIIRTTD